MNYEGQICRGPMERSSYMLPVAVGCSYNQCKFCTLFRHLKYRELPMEQIEAELERVRSLGGNPKHVLWERTIIWTRPTVKSTASKAQGLYSMPIS